MIVLIVILLFTVLLVSVLVYKSGIDKDSPNPIFDNQLVSGD